MFVQNHGCNAMVTVTSGVKGSVVVQIGSRGVPACSKCNRCASVSFTVRALMECIMCVVKMLSV